MHHCTILSPTVSHFAEFAEDRVTDSDDLPLKNMMAYREQRNEGCHIHGQLQVNKVAGNFHIAPGKSYQQGRVHMHDLIPFGDNRNFNMSHTINKLSFGHDYPGSRNPLDGATMTSNRFSLAYKYFLKVVPTQYVPFSTRASSISPIFSLSKE